MKGMEPSDLRRAEEDLDADIPDEWYDGEVIDGLRFGYKISEYLGFANEAGEKALLMDEGSTKLNALVGV